MDTMQQPSVLIAGWWYNELVVEQQQQGITSRVQLRAHLGEDSLQYYNKVGLKCYYLPEINEINNRRYAGDFTEKYALPFYDHACCPSARP
jgi:hypothetical protein